MLIALLVITVLVGIWLTQYHSDIYNIGVCSFMASGIIAIFLIITLVIYIGYTYNEERIEMLEQHNQEIETRIRVVVENYLEHEGNIYDFENEDITMLFVLVPQLSSNVVVQREMELYISNSEEIKSLKLGTIDRKVLAWWLWFGNS